MWQCTYSLIRLQLRNENEKSTKSAHHQKNAYIVFTPLKPDFYTVELGFTGVYINFLISAQNKDCGYSLEPSCRGGSNKYTQLMF